MAFRALVLFFLCIFVNVESANILGLFHVPSFSHNIVGQTLSKALAERGHHVTMVSPFPLKTPMKNYEDIYLEEEVKFKEKGVMEMIMAAENASVYTQLATMQDIMVQMAELCLNDSQITTLLASKKTFDLVMMDWALNDAFLGIADYYKAPVVVVSPVGSTVITNKITANPAPFAYVPSMISGSSDEMGFFMRLSNTFGSIAYLIYEHFSQEPSQDALLHKYFPNAPRLPELIKNVSLVFLNSHFSIETPRPYVPNMIPIGGLHMQEPKELPPELKKFLDEAKEGVLYFSLGNNARSSDLPADKINFIIRTFKNLPVKVLWKFEGDNVPKVSANVRIGKWFPQSDLLAHPNVKIFVTHGGLLSTIESIYRGVPMVGIPCFSDQEPNVENNVRKGFSEMVHLNDLNEESLTSAIKKILTNPRYGETVRKQSALLKDQPLKPLNNAVFWVEYVLRHKGAPHLKTGALKLEWYQYYLLDIAGFLVSIAALILFILYKVLNILKEKMCGKKKYSQDPLLKKRKKE